MSNLSTPGATRWLRDYDTADEFWSELRNYPQGRPIRLHLSDGSSDEGDFGGAEEVTGLTYSPEPDGQASIVASDGESLRNHLRVYIVGFTPLG
jgi:hypothetical protein